MNQREALKLALEALELEDMACRYEKDPTPEHIAKTITAIREALAQPEQEPVPEEPAGHIAGRPQPSGLKEPWVERWYGSGPERGWWICCGREHIAHLGTEVSSDEVSKIVDAHNRHIHAAQQQQPVAVVSGYYSGQCVILPTDPARIFNSGTALYTTPPQPEQNKFNPDWDAMAVMVEEQQRMAKRIAELEAQRKPLTDEEIEKIWWETKPYFDKHDFTRAIEAAHGIKGDA